MPIYHTLPLRDTFHTGRLTKEGARMWASQPWAEEAILVSMLTGGRFDGDVDFASKSAAAFARRLAIQLSEVENAAP